MLMTNWLTTDLSVTSWKSSTDDTTDTMITSTLNGITKWPGPGNSAYDAAAALMGEEVRARSV